LAKSKKNTLPANEAMRQVCSPSQYVNLGWLLASVGTLFIPPLAGLLILVYLYKRIEVSCWEYRFHDDYLVEKRGVFNVNEEFVNYFRIKSIKLEQPLWMRFFGLSVVQITTSENFKTYIQLYAVKNGQDHVDFLQRQVKIKRRENGIRDFDLFVS